jgi:hypothetical protein
MAFYTRASKFSWSVSPGHGPRRCHSIPPYHHWPPFLRDLHPVFLPPWLSCSVRVAASPTASGAREADRQRDELGGAGLARGKRGERSVDRDPTVQPRAGDGHAGLKAVLRRRVDDLGVDVKVIQPSLRIYSTS